MKRKLTLTLTTDGEHVSAVDVQLPPFDATTLLAQRQASVASALLPSVLGVCAQAQAAAAVGAVGAACGRPLPSALIAGHTLAVQIESVQESLRSLCLALPEALRSRHTAQGAALIADFAKAWRDGTAFLARLQKALRNEAHDVGLVLASLNQEVEQVAQSWDVFCSRHVHGTSVLNWQGEEKGRVMDDSLPIMRWFQRMAEEIPTLGQIALEPLPLEAFHTDSIPWQTLVDTPYDASVGRRVQHDPRMERVVSRFGNSAAARLWARFVDVAKTLNVLFDRATTKGADPWVRVYVLDDGDGMAEVECARGVLIHRAQLVQQNIAAYDIYAPTDWNLHRDGALATLLGHPASDTDQLHQHATWLVQVLDPCVAFEIEIVHA